MISSLQLESGYILESCQVAYKSWGCLNSTRNNVLVICHALTGTSDASDWWQPLIGPGKTFDSDRFFIFCANVLGSPYGSASPLTTNPRTGQPYANDFPETTVRDDVRAHQKVIAALGVESIAAVIGGSMGGMLALEWPLCCPQPGYVRQVIAIATAANHSAWGISWAETQRQCIYADPKFQGGRYPRSDEGQPSAGLAAARMIAMLTYRSSISFDSRFGRKPPRASDGVGSIRAATSGRKHLPDTGSAKRPISFSAQSYLRYQGDKFVKRFDANCYLNLINKMDSHDITRGRLSGGDESDVDEIQRILSNVPSGALVIGITTDALFLPEQQIQLAQCLPNATLEILESSDGHDGFLLEFERLHDLIQSHLKGAFPEFYQECPASGLQL